MANRSLNQVLGANLGRIMKARCLSAKALGLKAGVAPNTIGNYLKAADKDGHSGVVPTSGKERSAKLAEVELLANALEISPLALLTDEAAAAATVQAITEAVSAAIDALPAANPKARLHDVIAPGQPWGKGHPTTLRSPPLPTSHRSIKRPKKP